MTPIKSVLTQIQEQEKKNHHDVVAAFAEQNCNLNLCKLFLNKLIQSDLTCNEIKSIIKDFLNDLNTKEK